MYNWTFNTYKYPSFISSYWLEEDDDEVEWLEEEYEDYEDEEPSEHNDEDKGNTDISDADF